MRVSQRATIAEGWWHPTFVYACLAAPGTCRAEGLALALSAGSGGMRLTPLYNDRRFGR